MPIHTLRRWFGITAPRRQPTRRGTSLRAERLESREVPAAFVVTNPGDDSTGATAGQLRSIINQANLSGDATNSISFNLGAASTISLNAALPTISKTGLTITGPGSASLTVSGANKYRVFDIAGGAMTTALSGLTIASGSAATGAGISIAGGSGSKLTITKTSFTGNKASGIGGAIYVASSVTFTSDSSTFTSNEAAGLGGGAIAFATASTVTLNGSTFSGNAATASVAASATNGFGGAVLISGGPLAVRASTFTGNGATNGGGALSIGGSATATLTNSTVVDNSAGTSGVPSQGGGGLYRAGNAIVTVNSTILAHNSSLVPGGPTFNGADAAYATAGLLTANSSLIGVADAGNFTISGSNNLTGTVATPLDPKLASLASNGGSTQTRMPIATSPVINKGSNSLPMSQDQRGMAREMPSGFADIGAVEMQNTAPAAKIASVADITVTGGTGASFAVYYADVTALNGASFDGDDVVVSGPSGTMKASFVSMSAATGSATQNVTYSIAAPGGTWDASDAGTYTVSVNAGQVGNAGGSFVPAATLATFQVLQPASFVVTTTADSGAGSLRQAIIDANTNGNTGVMDNITFSTAFDGGSTINLTSGELAITDAVTITGKGANLLTLHVAATNQRHFNISGAGTITVNISGMTLNGGNRDLTKTAGTDQGGSVWVADENVTLTGLTFSGNYASQDGGAIVVANAGGVLTVTGSTFTNNSSTANDGGAISVSAASKLTVINSTFSGNTATSGGAQGGAIYFSSGGGAVISGSTFTGNIAGETGGALSFLGAANLGGVSISNSTFDGNQANATTAATAAGGAIRLHGFSGVFTLANATVTGNKVATGSTGGGIGLNVFGNSTLTLSNSIIAGNTAINGTATDIGSGTAVTVGANRIAYTALAAGVNLSGLNNINAFNVATNLDPLAMNGGPTMTRALKSTSSAIDAGGSTTLSIDQRGYNRVVGSAADLGAFEFTSAAKVTTVTINGGLAQRSTLTSVGVTFNDLVSLTSGSSLDQAFVVTPLGGGAAVPASITLTISGGQSVAMLTFPTLMANSLADGRYQLTVNASKLTSAGGALDGNGDGTAGGDFVLGAGSKLFRLYGDGDGSGAVDAQDVVIFLNAYGTTAGQPGYLVYMDVNPAVHNSTIDADDVVGFLDNYGVTLP